MGNPKVVLCSVLARTIGGGERGTVWSKAQLMNETGGERKRKWVDNNKSNKQPRSTLRR